MDCNGEYTTIAQNEPCNDSPKNEKDQKVNKDDSGSKSSAKIRVFGHEISYDIAFGITLLILFTLLFFPGIGVAAPKQ